MTNNRKTKFPLDSLEVTHGIIWFDALIQLKCGVELCKEWFPSVRVYNSILFECSHFPSDCHKNNPTWKASKKEQDLQCMLEVLNFTVRVSSPRRKAQGSTLHTANKKPNKPKVGIPSCLVHLCLNDKKKGYVPTSTTDVDTYICIITLKCMSSTHVGWTHRRHITFLFQ